MKLKKLISEMPDTDRIYCIGSNSSFMCFVSKENAISRINEADNFEFDKLCRIFDATFTYLKNLPKNEETRRIRIDEITKKIAFKENERRKLRTKMKKASDDEIPEIEKNIQELELAVVKLIKTRNNHQEYLKTIPSLLNYKKRKYEEYNDRLKTYVPLLERNVKETYVVDEKSPDRTYVIIIDGLENGRFWTNSEYEYYLKTGKLPSQE